MRGLEASLSIHHFTFQENNMKNLRTLSAAFVLTLVLAAPAFAGYIECPVASPTPPAAPAFAGHIECGVAPPDSAPAITGSDTGNVAGHIETPVAPTDPVTTAA